MKTNVPFLIACCLFFGLMRQTAQAQTIPSPPMVPISAVMPAGADPTQFNLDTDGQLLTGITGADFLPNDPADLFGYTGGKGGVQIQAASTTTLTFRRLVFGSTYINGELFVPSVASGLQNLYDPWTVSNFGVLLSTGELTFQTGGNPFAGAIGETITAANGRTLRLYSTFVVDLGSNGSTHFFNNFDDVKTFAESSFTIQAFVNSVPEPGAVALALVTTIGGAFYQQRRRRTRARLIVSM